MSDLNTEIVNTTRALIVVLDTDGRIVMFNPACERVSGYRFEEVQGLPFWELPFLLPEEIDGARSAFEELKAGTFPNVYENSWIAKSGGRHFIEWSNSAVTDESGRVTYVIGTGIDVTEQRAAERTLRASETRFRDLTENLPLVFWTREMPSGRISYISGAYEKIWGRRLGDLEETYQSFVQSIHPDDRETLFRQMQRETELHEPTETEYRIIRPDGAVRWVHSRTIPVQDETGQVLCIVGFAEDITERKRVQEAQREAEANCRMLFESSLDAILFTAPDGRILAANPEACRIFGRTAEELRDLGWAVVVDPTDPRLAAAREERTRTGRFKGELTLVRRDGTKFPVEVSTVAFRDINGEDHTSSIIRDISERKLAEAQRLSHDASLRAALVKEVHHRIKNNLQGVITLVQTLATKHPENAELLEAIVTRINVVATVHGLYGSTNERELRLDQILLRLVSSLKALYADLPVHLSTRINSASLRVMECEIVPLALVLNEVIMNAVKHSDSVAHRAPVDVALENAHDHARIVVRNHAGRLPEQFDFDTGAGLGNGLALVKSLLPSHGALLRFANAADGGVRAELTLRPPVITFEASET